MLPRVSVLLRPSVIILPFRSAPNQNGFLPITLLATKATLSQRKKHRDPYVLAQSQQRKDANLSRQKELQEQRKAALGDPIRGISTPFVESFDHVGNSAADGKTTKADDKILNHFVKLDELEAVIKHSHKMTSPIISQVRDAADPVKEQSEMKLHEKSHAKAVAAIMRIVNLANGNSKDKTRANVIRCVDKFGRHKTDQHLKPRPSLHPVFQGTQPRLEKTRRAGPDTGSPEVQIAILTAKLRVMDKTMKPGKRSSQKDKVNMRNMMLLGHKRQKLLKYLWRKERGSERWQHLVDTLGLTDGTWQGELNF